MENFFLDNKDVLFHFDTMDIDRIIKLYEDDFREAQTYPEAPKNTEDARDSYKRVMEIVGSIAAEYMAPYAAEVDEQGVVLENGEVRLAQATARAWDMLSKAELTGMAMSRKYGGLNMPMTLLTMAGEVLSRADASFLNLGLQQDIGLTLENFGNEDQKQRVIPLLAKGKETSAMILTEPDAGSDLQAVSLKATQAPDGTWRLNGVKRFITNGCGRIGLVLARSEDREGARGLSLFLYHRDKHTKIRRVEEKLGIHGSPTCEMQFDNAPAELVGERGWGLIKYTMWLMNSARLSVASQGVGIAEAAYREAEKYARERIQFGAPIINLPPVFEMLTNMRVSIEAARSLLYETARAVDMKEGLERYSQKHPEQADALKADIKKYTKLAALYTPMAKLFNTEMANKVTYDAIQIHGGTGYMKDFSVERHYRDARITNIYEGTSQLQVVAAIGGVMSGVAASIMDEFENEDWSELPRELIDSVKNMRTKFEKAQLAVREAGNEQYTNFHARRLVEMATDIIVSWLMLRDGKHSERKLKAAEIFITLARPRIEAHSTFVLNNHDCYLKNYQAIIEEF